MIKTLTIKNFQSWKDTIFDFHGGVNVIIGLSDNGKSAVIKALKLLIFNRPLGGEYQSNWGGKTSVEVATEEGQTISRSQSENGTDKTYLLNSLPPFKAFGTSVPDEIIQALNIDEVNFQSQFTPHFLLSRSAGDVAQHFNRIAHLDKIDTSLQNITRWIKEITNTISNKTFQLSEQEKELARYNHLEKFEIDVEVLEDMEKKLNYKKSNISKFKKLIGKLTEVNEQLEEFQPLFSIESDVNFIIDLIEKRKQLRTQHRELCLLKNSIEVTNNEIEKLNNLISLDGKITEIQKLIQTKENLTTKKDRLAKLIKTIKGVNIGLETANTFYTITKKEFEKSMGDRCLLCGTKLK